MGLFSSKTTAKIDKTTTPITPGYMDQPINDAWGRIHQIGGMDPSQFVAPLSALQQQAGMGAGALSDGGLFGRAADMTQSLLGGGNPSASAGQWGGVNKYMDPYIGQVVDATMARNNQNRDMGMESNRLRYSGGRAGSNEAVSGALLGGQYDLNDQQTIGGLLSTGYGQASQLANAQAERENAVNMQNAQLGAQMFGQRLAGAGQLGNIATAQGANERANIGTQADIGGTFQNQDLLNRTSPLNLINWQTGQMGALSPFAQLQTGQQETGIVPVGGGTSGLQKAGQIAQIASTAASLFSDVRLKQDIVKVGEHPSGVGVYDFAYIWAPEERYRGVMAQELMEVRPDLVRVHPSGFLMVEYGGL